jgi:phospholipase D1/2
MIVSFFNLRSYDRIALTQEIVEKEKKSGIDTLKADLALDLDLIGVDKIKNQQVTVSSLAAGDSLDAVAHSDPHPSKSGDIKPFEDLFSWNRTADVQKKNDVLNTVLSRFEQAGSESPVSDSIAEQAMMTGREVWDEKWVGDDKEAVKNFVTEELYIHTKVLSFSYTYLF